MTTHGYGDAAVEIIDTTVTSTFPILPRRLISMETSCTPGAFGS